MGTFLAIALALSAAHRPVVVYRYHVPTRHHVTTTRHYGASQSQYVKNFGNELRTH